MVLNGFESAWITEAIENSKEVFERIENPPHKKISEILPLHSGIIVVLSNK